MKLFNQDVLRVIVLDRRYGHISTVEITKGIINESLVSRRLGEASIPIPVALIDSVARRRSNIGSKIKVSHRDRM
jgi:hypothetical protein